MCFVNLHSFDLDLELNLELARFQPIKLQTQPTQTPQHNILHDVVRIDTSRAARRRTKLQQLKLQMRQLKLIGSLQICQIRWKNAKYGLLRRSDHSRSFLPPLPIPSSLLRIVWRILGQNLRLFEYLMQLTDTLSHNIISHNQSLE